jgi:hypothetical protein
MRMTLTFERIHRDADRGKRGAYSFALVVGIMWLLLGVVASRYSHTWLSFRPWGLAGMILTLLGFGALFRRRSVLRWTFWLIAAVLTGLSLSVLRISF